MDADDEDPLGRTLPATDGEQAAPTSSHPTEDETTQQPTAAIATATDLALEQDA